MPHAHTVILIAHTVILNAHTVIPNERSEEGSYDPSLHSGRLRRISRSARNDSVRIRDDRSKLSLH
jgi:hypothetical protein